MSTTLVLELAGFGIKIMSQDMHDQSKMKIFKM